VFGVPDPKYGEEVCAWVIARHGQHIGEAEIADFCRDKIAHYKVPRHVRIVEQFPLTATGKPQKFQMRDAMMQWLGRRAERTA
jgi:fatty-acyl-CoA synthase